MNNILTFEDYRKMNIRQVESVIYRQFVEESIKNEDEVSEGLIRNFINKQSSGFIQAALGDEIEKGKELEKSIKEALDGLNKGFEEIEKTIDTNTEAKPKLEAIEKVKEAIKAVQSQAFDTLTMIGSEGEIDFAGFMGSASVAAAANFGILFSPIRSVFITRKAYKYFLGIIKQTIRRNLLVIQLNFDQFENLILQKSFESEEDSEFMTKIGTLNAVMTSLTEQLCGEKTKFLKGSKNKELKDKIEIIRKNTEQAYKQHKESSRSNPLRSLWEDQHNNTYTRTLEQIKQYINDDSQKELDALKNSITKMAGNDVDLGPYGELLISAAEEYAIKTNHGINNNFIKMSSVFNLENQKKLIDLITETQEENLKEIEEKKKNIEKTEFEKKLNESIENGKKIYEEKLKDSSKKYTLDEFEEEFSGDDIKSLSAYLGTDEGKEDYENLIKKNPIYKYILNVDIKPLNDLLSAINRLKIIKITDIDEFNNSIVNKDQTLYYIMAEKSIADAVKSKKSEEYFGIESVKDKTDGNTLMKDVIEKTDDDKTTLNRILSDAINIRKKKKERYFLTFDGSGNTLFDILHKDFKTKIFKSKGYESNISLENKEDIMKIIYKKLKIGNSILSLFAEYLVRLEAHMLLTEKDPWFVIKDNTELFNLNCFKPKSNKILNKNAFVEIGGDDYENVKLFLTKYHSFSDNDFDIGTDEKSTNK